ncbi:unnamed protein product, partial [Caretta caretta]
PMDQGVLESLKQRYQRDLLNRLLMSDEAAKNKGNMLQRWKKKCIKEAVYGVAEAWEDISRSTLQKLLPGCTEVDKDDIADWLENDTNYLGHPLLDDAKIIRTVLHADSDCVSEESAEEGLMEKNSHCDAAIAGNLFLQYLEQQPDTDPSELLMMKQLHDHTMKKRTSHLKQHKLSDFFLAIINR